MRRNVNIFTAALVTRVVHVGAGREEKDKCGGCLGRVMHVGAGREEKDKCGSCLETVEENLCRSFQGQHSFTVEETGQGWPAGYRKSSRRTTCYDESDKNSALSDREVASPLLDKVQWVFIRQLEMRESELKLVTMEVLATLHKM